MLLKVLKRWTGAGRKDTPKTETLAKLLEEAHEVALHGDRRSAIQAYERYLELDPTNVEALNGLGACLAEVGDNARATQVFELAHSLDDTFVPAMVNYGKLLAESNRAEEGLKLLRRARIVRPDFMHVDAVYAGLCLRLGETARSRRHQLRSWLANFDNLRLANCYLFWSSYDDIDEALVAAEHRFWAETVQAPDVHLEDAQEDPAEASEELPPLPQRRLRIGYLSPDLRNHSVRYFSRPLLDAHDRERVEVFVYHDFPTQDAHTQAHRERADHFHEVFELTDAQLCRLIRSHRLDVLVDLAGHTSHNRVSLLTHRMATVQLTALGYPPTTGLRTVDGKVVDRFALGPDDARHYAEQPVALPSSFWCFHPKEPIPIAPRPPVLTNGYITFGCVGNIAKITERVARTWARILAAVPDSRLLVRSISFEEPLAQVHFQQMLKDWGLPMDRVALRKPEGGVNFFASYNEIDIILDTFPFNGGTTTCFATYMGVPVVSLAGNSLVGRMGASVLGNAGASDLVVTTLDDYQRRAIELARDRDYLCRFKREIRERLQLTGLGNEAIFAREFEQACLDLLERKQAGRLNWESRIEPLPAKEIMRRAYAVVRRGNIPAARRIVDHCLREYPDHGPAHLLLAQMMAWDGREAEAVEWLSQRIAGFAPADQCGALLSLARTHLLGKDRAAASAVLRRLERVPQHDPFDAAQARLYAAACRDTPAPVPPTAPGSPRRVLVLVPCDDATWFKSMRQQMEATMQLPAGWAVHFERCPEADRIRAYRACMQGGDWQVLVLMHRTVLPLNPRFLAELDRALGTADVVSFAGATRWSRLEWRQDRFDVKAGGFFGGSSERPDMVELQLVGYGTSSMVPGMAVLDGHLLAIRREALSLGQWDEELAGCDALLEEAWVYRAGQQGARLAVHRGLGAFINGRAAPDDIERAEALMHWASVMDFDPFDEPDEDVIALSVPLANAAEAVRVADAYLDRP